MNSDTSLHDSAPRSPVRAIGRVQFDPATGELAGPGGRERLDPKVAAVLLVLSQRAGEVVSREDLLAAVWPGLVVTDDVLRRCIYQLRTQLQRAGGDASARSLVETLPKRGYRLRPDAPEEAEPVARRPGPGRLIAGVPGARVPIEIATALLVVIAAVAWVARDRLPRPESPPGAASPSIAVLPFVDLSETQDQRYFAEGLAEEVLNLLVRLPELRVIARTSSFSFRDRDDLDIREIGGKLGVTHLLEGSVRKAGGRVRVTAQLVKAADGSHLWSRTYDRDVGDLLEMQREIASAIARTLEIRLTDRAVSTSVRAVDPAAHEHYLYARFFYSRRSPGDLAAAERRLERAVVIDPNHAQAWALLSGITSIRMYDEGGDPEASLETMRIAVERALALAPESGEVHARAAQYYLNTGDPVREREHWERALALEPNNVLVVAFRAGVALDHGDFTEAVRYAQRAVELDPLGVVNRSNLAVHLAGVGRLDDAWSQLMRARELNPGITHIAELEAELLVMEGRNEEAIAVAERLPDGILKYQTLALAFAGLERISDFDTAMARLHAAGDPERALALAKVHAWRNEADDAFEWLDRATRTIAESSPSPDGRSRVPIRWGPIHSPLFLPLYDDPRLQRYFAPAAGVPDA